LDAPRGGYVSCERASEPGGGGLRTLGVGDTVVTVPSTPVELLVVDGNADLAESVQLLLQTRGWVVHVALDAATAMTVVERRPIALAFIAIGLPDVDGYTLARRLRETARPCALIALTGYGHAEDRRRALEAGFDDHVLKPASPAQLEALVTRYVRSP
jgi:DNA-binding response OmpR family regulator